jgi:hypothetical protein
MKVYGGQRNYIKKKHKRQLKQQRWDAGQPINNGPPKTARQNARTGRAQHPISV